MDMSFKGKSAVVTGGGSGMGEAVARRLAREGASVLVADFNEENGARVATEIEAAGGVAVFHRTDVSDPSSAKAMVDAAVERFGKLDLAANIAGIAQSSTALQDIGQQQWERVNAVNAAGVLYCLQAEITALLAARGGAIVNVTSTGGLRAFDGLAAYVASKHAVVGLTRSAALENLRKGIRVNAVAPGIVRTPMLAALSEAEIEAYAAAQPSGRLGTADEIANVVVFLLSDEALFVSGAIIPVDGGQLVA
ncbi:SDR family NAD(P)-dependent oxidoreductase [Rhizobium binxianense]